MNKASFVAHLKKTKHSLREWLERLSATLRLLNCEKKSDKQFLFILGVGGSGSQWCAQAFTDNKNVHCWHDLSGKNLRDGYWEGSYTKYSYRQILRKLDIFRSDNLYIEMRPKNFLDPLFLRMFETKTHFVGNSDPFIGVFAEQIHRRYPSAKFLLVARNGINNVMWYLNNKEGRQNIFQLDKVYVPEWGRYTWFERACLWWKNKNRIFFNILKDTLPQENYRIVTLENLTKCDDTFKDIWSFLGLPSGDENLRRIQEIRSKRISKYAHTLSTFTVAENIWNKWDLFQKKTFCEICGTTMTLFGYPLP